MDFISLYLASPLTINDIAETLGNGEQSDIIFLDFSNAFNKVSHHHYGFRGDTLDWIKTSPLADLNL